MPMTLYNKHEIIHFFKFYTHIAGSVLEAVKTKKHIFRMLLQNIKLLIIGVERCCMILSKVQRVEH